MTRRDGFSQIINFKMYQAPTPFNDIRQRNTVYKRNKPIAVKKRREVRDQSPACLVVS